MSTVRTICLLVYAEGINLVVKFMVVDFPSAYNAIIGRPLIHAIKAMASIYHQVILFPTKKE